MTIKKHSGGSRKRPTATLDLKATEVKTEPADKTTAAASQDPKGGEKPKSPVSGRATADERKALKGETPKDASPQTPKSASSPSATASGKAEKSPGETAKSENGKKASQKKTTPSVGGGGGGAARPPGMGARPGGPFSAGFVPLMLAGILGAVVAIAAWQWLFPSAPTGGQTVSAPSPAVLKRLSALETRLAALQKSAAKSGGAPAADLKPVTEDLSRLETQLEDLAKRFAAFVGEQKDREKRIAEKLATAGTPEDMSALKARLDDMARQLASLAQAAEKGGDVASAAAVAAQIAEAEKRLTEKRDAALSALRKTLETAQKNAVAEGVAPLAARLDQMADRIAQLAERQGRLSGEQKGLKGDLDRITQTLAQQRGELSNLQSRLSRLETQIAQLGGQVARPADITARIAPLEARLAELAQAVMGVRQYQEKARAEGRSIALAIELSNLKRAFEMGAPYREQLERVKPYVPKDVDMGVFAAYADTGLPTISSLKQRFPKLLREALAADADTQSSAGSFTEQLLSKMKHIVRIRKTGLVPGDDTAAILARMEYRLMREDDLAAALEEAKALKGRPRDVMAKWLEQAQAVLESRKVLERLETRIIAALGGAKTN